MATLEECLAAVEKLSEKLASASAEGHVRNLPDRVIVLELTDLDSSITGALRGDRLVDIVSTLDPRPPADVTLRCTAETLLSLCANEIAFPMAWATGKLTIDAGLRDLIRLRAML